MCKLKAQLIYNLDNCMNLGKISIASLIKKSLTDIANVIND